jgi:hypothetical protein
VERSFWQISGKGPCMVVRAAASNLGISRTNSTCCLLLSPGSARPRPQCGPAACGHGLPMALSGSAMPAPQSKAAASRTVADWLATQLDGDQPEQWLRDQRFFPSLLAVGSLFCSLRISRLVG